MCQSLSIPRTEISTALRCGWCRILLLQVRIRAGQQIGERVGNGGFHAGFGIDFALNGEKIDNEIKKSTIAGRLQTEELNFS